MAAPSAGDRRVALYLPNLEGGGAERMMVALARGLAMRGTKVDLVLAKAYGPYLAEVPASVNIVDLDSRGVLASFPRLLRYLRATRPMATIGTLPYANLVLLWATRLAGTGTRVYIREASTPSMVRPAWSNVKQRLVEALAKVFYSRADGVIAVSHGVAEDLHRFMRVPRAKISTIYNPVVTPDLEELARGEPDHHWFRPGGPPVVLSVGRLGREKDFPTLIRGFAELRSERDARLLILGEGPERKRLEQLIADLGLSADVELPGFVANPFPYMARAAVYALSSEREGLPGSLIQAMACGCPVVSTDCPSGPREVLQDGRLGKLVAVGQPSALAGALGATLDAPTAAAELKARSLAFSQKQSLDAYSELLFSGNPISSAASRPVGMKG